MKQKGHFIFNVLLVACLLSACNTKKGNKHSKKTGGEEVYDLYCSDGGTLSYDDWITVLNRGSKSKLLNVDSGTEWPSSSKGSVGDVYIDVNNWDFYVKLDTGWSLMGNIRVEEQGLDYFLMNDDTYAVGLGKAKYLSNIKIPAIHFGKTISMVADSFYPSGMTDKSFDIERRIEFPESVRRIGQNAFVYVPNKTTLKIPYDASTFEKFTFGSSWANNFVEVELTDQTIKIAEVYDTLTVSAKSDFAINKSSVLDIKLSTTKFGGIIETVNSEDDNLEFDIEDKTLCMVQYSSEEHRYVISCARMGTTVVHFKYKNLTTDLKIVVISEDAFTSAFNTAIEVGEGLFLTYDYETYFDHTSRQAFFVARTSHHYSVSPNDGFDISLSYEYSATINGVEVDLNNYFDEVITYEYDEYTKGEVVFIKNFPSKDVVETKMYPRINVVVTAECSGITQKRKAVIVLTPVTYEIRKATLEDIYSKDPLTGEFKFLKDENNGSFSFSYSDVIETQGKLIYVAPDLSFGLLQDGDHFIELYQLDNCTYFLLQEYHHMVGQNVFVKGRLYCKYGNITLAYITECRGIRPGDTTHQVKDASSFVFDQSGLLNNEWWAGPMMFNQVGRVTNLTIAGDEVYRVKRGSISTTLELINKSDISVRNNRYEFYVRLSNGSIVNVTTDYHSCSNGEKLNSFGTALEQFLKTKINAGETISLGGYIRWENSREFQTEGRNRILTSGNWCIVPFLEEHLVQ